MSSPSPIHAPEAPTATSAGMATGSSTSTAAQQAETAGSVSSMSDLKEKAPEVYKAMMQGIAMNMCTQSQRAQEHLKKMQEEFRREAEGG